MIEGREAKTPGQMLRCGMVGGGPGSFIGGVHRAALGLDNSAQLVAGCFSRDGDKNRQTGEALRIADDRVYADFETMALREGQRDDPIDQAFSCLQQIVCTVNSLDKSQWSEADTRLKLVDHIVFDVLGWSKTAAKVEERAGSGFTDYSLRKNSCTRLIVEAKKDSLSFTLGNFIPVIDVMVNGVKKKFGIDSGAEINLLDLKKSKDIMAQFQPIKTIRLTGSDGKESDVLAGRLYKLSILEKYRCASMATVLINMDNLNKIYASNLDGILGFEFLSPWLFSINYKKQKLYFHQLKVVNP